MQPEGMLERQLTEAHASGWRIAVHANRDRGIDRVLSGLKTARGEDMKRHRIEH